jgi:hypothetical protein
MSFLLAVGAAAVGAVLGYMLRYREWLREKRLTAYTEFIAAFSVVSRRGIVATGRADVDTFQQALDDYKEHGERFGSLRAQVSLLATAETDAAAQACVGFVTEDLYPRRAVKSTDERDQLQWHGLVLEQSFIRAARRELGPRLPRVGGNLGQRSRS